MVTRWRSDRSRERFTVQWQSQGQLPRSARAQSGTTEGGRSVAEDVRGSTRSNTFWREVFPEERDVAIVQAVKFIGGPAVQDYPAFARPSECDSIAGRECLVASPRHERPPGSSVLLGSCAGPLPLRELPAFYVRFSFGARIEVELRRGQRTPEAAVVGPAVGRVAPPTYSAAMTTRSRSTAASAARMLSGSSAPVASSPSERSSGTRPGSGESPRSGACSKRRVSAPA